MRSYACISTVHVSSSHSCSSYSCNGHNCSGGHPYRGMMQCLAVVILVVAELCYCVCYFSVSHTSNADSHSYNLIGLHLIVTVV